MKALIFNSGLGSRLGALTHDRPKSMVRLGSGETIFHRQLRILSACGIREFVVTTGPFPELLEAEAAPFEAAGCSFAFVPNPVYSETNYIYSMWLARGLLRTGDFLMLHGDLVFDAAYAQAVVDSPLESLGSVNPALPQPCPRPERWRSPHTAASTGRSNGLFWPKAPCGGPAPRSFPPAPPE